MLVLIYGILSSVASQADDWPQWRGPNGNNHAASGATAPVTWGEDEGRIWTTPVPGKGHSSPTLVGDRIYLTTADAAEETQSLLIFDKNRGTLTAQKVVHRGNLAKKIYKTNTHASGTVASDGKRVFALFQNNNATWLTSLDLAGEQLWQKRVGEFAPVRFQFGHGCSPVIDDGLVIVANEQDGNEGGSVVAFDTATGEEKWRTARKKNISFSTPSVVRLNGGTKLLISGADHVTGFDFTTGKKEWATPGTTGLTCGTIVWDQESGLAFASGGFPDSQTVAVRMRGDHGVAWENKVKCYEQSMLVVDGFVFAVADSGVAFCWRGSDGEEMWKKRLGGKYSSSPLLVDDRIYVTNQSGMTFVFKATPDGFQSLAKNKLGDTCYATPAPVDGRLYHRFAKGDGAERQEFLTAIGDQ